MATSPSNEEMVAIVAAIEVLWPRPVAAAGPSQDEPHAWRFSGRWWNKPVPVARQRPWS